MQKCSFAAAHLWLAGNKCYLNYLCGSLPNVSGIYMDLSLLRESPLGAQDGATPTWELLREEREYIYKYIYLYTKIHLNKYFILPDPLTGGDGSPLHPPLPLCHFLPLLLKLWISMSLFDHSSSLHHRNMHSG